ncbi:MAG: hypothetical protein GXP48_04195 [Acidobacteria bacterium]|nr:hypothetical protein [Acidobacteriota bacterium]
MVTLSVEGSAGSELTYSLGKDTISIGAAGDNDIVVRSPGVAPYHLLLQRSGKTITFIGQKRQIAVLNGERRARGVLHVGDRLRIGTAVVTFRGLGTEEVDIEDSSLDRVVEQQVPVQAIEEAKTAVSEARSELVLYSEPSRLAEARRQMVEIFRLGVQADPVPQLRSFFESVFPRRQAMLAWLDEDGGFQPIASIWTGDVPRFPARTFEEINVTGRFARVFLRGRHLLLYPVQHGAVDEYAYLLAETSPDSIDDDELVLAELSRMLAAHWDRVEKSGSLYGPWEASAKDAIEQQLPGTSNAIKVLRDGVLQAARGSQPVLICGRRGIGRTTVAALIASLHPRGPLPLHVIQGREADEKTLRAELFGDGSGEGAAQSPAALARGGVLVVRDVHLFPLNLQRELAAAIRSDLGLAFGPAVRWMATTGEDVLALVNDGELDADLFNLFHYHLMRVPSLQERKEDLPLLMVNLLNIMAAEQKKTIRGIELNTLNSLLSHPFEGQMTELVSELRRLVTAAQDGEMVHGRVPLTPPEGGSFEAGTPPENVIDLLNMDDLKTVIPGIERMIIDRVLRKTLGNQSKSARILNLSRGALIAKMKEYEIPDYRSLRRRK